MNTKLLKLALAAALALSSSLLLAAQQGRGEINTLDVRQDRISIDTQDMTIGPDTHVTDARGRYKGRSDLKVGQKVHYTVNDEGFVTSINIFPSDSRKLRELDYDLEAGDD